MFHISQQELRRLRDLQGFLEGAGSRYGASPSVNSM
jgi:hypothetical protein